jgi:hypothetical protein
LQLRPIVRVRLLTGLIAVALAAGCITPSIPIPPPEPSAMMFEVDPLAGEATFSYRPTERYADAKVYIFNADQGMGVITTARPDGGVDPTPFPAVIGNQVVITFEMEDDAVSSCVRVTEGTPSALDVCY